MARAKVYHRICHICQIDKPVTEFPKHSSKCNDCIKGNSKGQIVTCVECGREGKLCARGLCNTCYARWAKNRKVVKCIDCGEMKPHHTHGRCRQCAGRYRYETNRQAILDWQRENRKKHPEREKAKDKQKYEKNKASGHEQRRVRKYYLDNRDQLLKYQQDYHKEHPGLRTHYSEVRRAKVKSLPHTLTNDEWSELVEQYDHCCAYCGKYARRLHREHKIPVSRGGGYTKDNIVPACAECNLRKRDKTDTEFREHLKLFEK